MCVFSDKTFLICFLLCFAIKANNLGWGLGGSVNSTCHVFLCFGALQARLEAGGLLHRLTDAFAYIGSVCAVKIFQLGRQSLALAN